MKELDKAILLSYLNKEVFTAEFVYLGLSPNRELKYKLKLKRVLKLERKYKLKKVKTKTKI